MQIFQPYTQGVLTLTWNQWKNYLTLAINCKRFDSCIKETFVVKKKKKITTNTCLVIKPKFDSTYQKPKGRTLPPFSCRVVFNIYFVLYKCRCHIIQTTIYFLVGTWMPSCSHQSTSYGVNRFRISLLVQLKWILNTKHQEEAAELWPLWLWISANLFDPSLWPQVDDQIPGPVPIY